MKSAAYISSGQGNGMYTLRVIHYTQNVTNSGKCYWTQKDHYSCNLSNDWETAYAKYLNAVNSRDLRQITNKNGAWELNEWGTCGSAKGNWTHSKFMSWKDGFDQGIMPFGKFLGHEIKTLEQSYRVWLRKFVKERGIATNNKMEKKTWALTFIALQPYEDEDNNFVTEQEAAKKAKQQEIEDAKAKSQYVGDIGDRIEKSLTCVAKYSYNGYYGPGTVSIFVDQDGNKLKTFGKCSMEKGETKTVTFTVKDFQDYKGEKQTLINRIK